MKEITGNLKRDMKDLLDESASIFTDFFKRGACTVRAVADKWKAFARDISDAVDELMKPPFAEGGPEAPAPVLNPESEPIVTVIESADEHFPVKLQMPLSRAERHIRRKDEQYREQGRTPQPVKVKIDYMRDGRTDRYFLPLEIGAGGSLLEQMRAHIDTYRASREQVAQLFSEAPEEYRETLQAELTPFIHENLNDLSTQLLPYFQRHCDIAELGRQLDEQAAMLPEKEQAAFRSAARKTVDSLHQSVNLGKAPERPAAQREWPAPEAPTSQQTEQTAPRQSVKVHLREIRQDRAAKPKRPVRRHDRPQR